MVGVGEAMVELAPIGGGLYRRGFAGDTLNTCWYLRRLVGQERRVAYLTRVGSDSVSSGMVEFFAAGGLDTTYIDRDSRLTVGLYFIELTGAERTFTYWRGQSAARHLADSPEKLAEAFSGAALIYLSGITLAVIEGVGRKNLFAALVKARSAGTKVAFDPNIRRRLWADDDTLRATLAAALEVADIALPSFDDETALWGDADPVATAHRVAAHRVPEIVVKNGAGPAVVGENRCLTTVPATAAAAQDTTGAGDSFNGAYLAARLAGLAPVEACRFAHSVAAEVIRHPGALVPPDAIAPFQGHLERYAAMAVRRNTRFEA